MNSEKKRILDRIGWAGNAGHGEHRKLFTDTMTTTTSTVAATVLGIIVVPLTTRRLGIELWGSWAAALAWALFFAGMFHMSIGPLLVRRVAAAPLARVVPTVLFLSIAASALALATAAFLWAFARPAFGGLTGVLLALGLISTPFLLWSSMAQGLFQVSHRLPSLAYVTFAGSSVNSLGIIVLVGGLGFGVAAMAFSSAFSNALIFALASWALWRASGPWQRPSLALAKSLVSDVPKLHLTAIGNYLFASSDLLIVNAFTAPADVGAYRLSLMVVALFMLPVTALTSAFFSQTARLGPQNAWPIQRRWTFVTFVGLLAGCLVVWPLVPFGVRIIAGDEFLPAVQMIRFLFFAFPGIALSQLFASQWIGRGMLWSASILTAANGVLNLIAMLVLVPLFGVSGAIYAKVATYGIALVINLGAAKLYFANAKSDSTASGAGARRF